ncbi:hypothetical protein K439DRAFT_1632008 [Ramaria rubella]|nr:hypothetical protein K439DRAFT_1632008 [Ramaria rubella]
MSYMNLSDDEPLGAGPGGRSRGYSSGYPSPRQGPNVRTNGLSPATTAPTGYGTLPSIPPNQGVRSGIAVGLSDPTLSEARRRKLDAINRLHSLGAQRDIDIPQIVVIGSQSAGKSSLIESISGISLPRASGTCTRCPTECRLVNSTDPWLCIVTLRFTTDESGHPYQSARNIPFGTHIKNPKDVEERLRRAQRAILNPLTDYREFLADNHPNPTNALNFSTNCVSLEIRGPEVTDLSFCDLPGLIASVSDNGRDEDVEEVKNLVSSHIKKESCIILVTVACETDFETQGAYRLAKQFDPNGTRTIGILTKPDRIPEGEHARWMKLIKNEIAVLQNGWYCVKQPSTADMDKGITFMEARRRGEDFFKTSPWSGLDPWHKKRLGTQAVTQKLNEFLMDVISKRFPELMQELQTMLQGTKEKLEALPPRPSTDSVLELMQLVSRFCDDLHRQAEGFSQGISETPTGIRNNQFEAIRAAHEVFRCEIRAVAPRFRPFPGSQAPVTEELQYEDEGIDVDGRPPSPEPEFLRAEEGQILATVLAPVYLDEVVEKIDKATTRELPGYFPFHVIQDLISSSTDQWRQPALVLINEIHNVVVDHQKNLVESHFGEHKLLYQTVANIMQEYTQKRREEVMARVKWLLDIEGHAFTLNKPLLADYTRKFLEYYRNQPVSYRPWNLGQSALEIMATVRAYFQVAYKRVVDTVPLAIDYELVRVQKRALQEVLSLGLRITGPGAQEYCRRLLAEPSEVAALRDGLENQRDRLMAAQNELLNI